VLPLAREHREGAIRELAKMAAARQQAIGADHPLVQEFWEIYDYIETAEDDRPMLNHARGDGVIAINLQHFEHVANERRVHLPPIADLKRVLKTSRHRKFVDIRAVNSAINAHHNVEYLAAPKRPTTVKCWVFEADRSARKGA
jgi:hypothetical protein